MFRRSYKYPQARVKQLHGGTYEVVNERNGATYVVMVNSRAPIGSPQRWQAVRKDSPSALRLVMRTKDDIMRRIVQAD